MLSALKEYNIKRNDKLTISQQFNQLFQKKMDDFEIVKAKIDLGYMLNNQLPPN